MNESFLSSRASKGLPENRGYFKFQHSWQATPSLSVKIDSNVTSDDQIFKTYAYTTADRVRQRADNNLFVTQRWESVNFVGRIYWYQDLTQPRNVELQRVPELKLTSVRQPLPGVPGLLYEGQASFTNFIREIGVAGIRADFHPRLYLPIPVAGLFTLTPYAGGRLTLYNQGGGGAVDLERPQQPQQSHEHRGHAEHAAAPAAGGVRPARGESRLPRLQPGRHGQHRRPPARHRAPRQLHRDPRYQPESQSAVRAGGGPSTGHRSRLRGAHGHRRHQQGERGDVLDHQSAQRPHHLGSERGGGAVGAGPDDPEPDLQLPHMSPSRSRI